jgi:hypothetical protein
MDASKQQTIALGEQCLQPWRRVNIIASMARFALVLVVVLGTAAFWPPAGAAERLSSRNCAAIAFHPIAAGTANGEQVAGYYKSRLGRIEVRASVAGGTARRYYVSLDGALLARVRGPLPPLVAACAKAKRLTAPLEPDHSCLGDRLVVLIADTDKHHYLLLYARRGRAWRFCSAGRA